MPCYNRAHDLRHTLHAYDTQTYSDPFEVIAIDDASTDGTYDILVQHQPKRYSLQVVRQDCNQGPASARNRGIQLAQAPLIAFVGDDIMPTSNFVNSHLAAHKQYPQLEVAILGKVAWPQDMPVNMLMRHIDGVGAQQFSYHFFKNHEEYDFRQFYTANISVKASFLQRANSLFDTSFPYAAFEDAEFAYRLANHGLRIIYDDRPVGYHYHYHTFWTFAKRQYRAGLMACRVVEKHPELASLLRVKKTRHLFVLRLLHRVNDSSVEALSKTAHWLEQQALYMGSSFEWQPHDLLDEFYLRVLEYHWRQGLIAGVFGDTTYAKVISYAYAVYYLGDFFRDFIPRAQQANVPVSMGSMEELNVKLALVESGIVKYLRKFWQAYGYRLTKEWLYTDQVPT